MTENDAERQSRIEECLKKHEAPVKLAHLKSKATASAGSTAATGLAAVSDAKAAALPAKSKKQQHREAKERRSKGLCTNFVLGKCNFGSSCRFGHDLTSFLSTRQPDLPGTCPFISTGSCPYGGSRFTHYNNDEALLKYGIMCRWAGTHAQTDDLHNQLRQSAQTVDSSGSAPDNSATSAGGDIPDGVVPLPVPTSVQPSYNSLDKHVQHELRQRSYDFSKADNVLKSLGIRISFKPSKQNNNKQSNANNNKVAAPAQPQNTSTAQADNTDVNKQEAEQPTDPAPAVVHDSTSAQEVTPNGDVSVEPAAKRQKLDDSGTTDAAFVSRLGAKEENAAMHVEVPLKSSEKKVIDFRNKTVLAPLTTVGNLPFRRVCKKLGVDVTVGEMALCTNLLQGQPSEWALLKRHPCEDIFGVQIAGGFPDAVARVCQLIDETCSHVDYVDINMGCPIDIVCDKGAGSALLLKPKRIEEIAKAADRSMSLPLTLKTRKGYYDDQDITHTFVDQIRSWGPIALTLHGRTRQQRYSRQADWDYISRCAQAADGTGLQLIGNGDVFSYTDWNDHVGTGNGPLTSCMVGRGALIKPWLFTEIKEQRHWDISASERLDLVKDFASAGLEHWGSDTRGVETTRKFLLEWLSYTHRYIPVGLLEVVPQRLHWRAPPIVGRSDLETLLSSDSPSDWIRISEMVLGRAPDGFTFTPKHKSSAYSSSAAAASAATGVPANGHGNAAADEDEQAEG